MRSTVRRLPGAAVIAASTALCLATAAPRPVQSEAMFEPAATPPVLPGDVFNYTTTTTLSISTAGQAPITSTTVDNSTIKASGPVTFNKHGGLTKLSYVHSAGLTVTEDTYVGAVAHGAVDEEVDYGDTYTTKLTEPFGTILGSGTLTYAVGSILSVYPEAAGQRWSPAATSTTVGKSSGAGSSGALTDIDYVDGSYLRESNVSFSGIQSTSTAKLLSNGTGKSVSSTPGFNALTTVVALPIPAKSGFAIPVTMSGGNELPNPPTPAKTVDVPDWYPSRDKPSDPLQSLEIVDLGLVTTPAACGARAGKKAFDLHGTSTILDPLAATYTTSVEDEYDESGLGPVCYIESSVSHAFGESSNTAGKVTALTVLKSVGILKSESGPHPLAAFASGGAFSLGFRFLDRMPNIPANVRR